VSASVVDIVKALSRAYTDEGVVIVLTSPHMHFGLRTPLEMCTTAAGRKKVLAWAESLDGMIST